MARARKIARETDKTGREMKREAKTLVVHIQAAEILGEFAVICVCSCHGLHTVKV